MKILIVDDHPIMRHGIRQILAAEPEMQDVVEAATADAASAALQAHRFDLVILDLNLPDRNGFSVLDEIRAGMPQLPVLIMSIQPEEHMAVRALKAGASGFLNKESAPEELVKAARSVVQGRKYISPRLAEWLALEVSGRRESLPHERLSDREYQVMCMLASGRSISEIAEDLGRSPNTISTFRARILRKMGVDNNISLSQYAVQHQLIR